MRNIYVSINEGEIVGVIGRNGSGKTTLLNIIAGILPVSEGEVTVNGRVSALLTLGAGFQDEFEVKIAADGTVRGGKYTEYEKKKDEIKEKGKYRIIGGTLEIDEKCIISGDLQLSNGETFKVTTGAILFKKDKPKELELGIGPDPADFI